METLEDQIITLQIKNDELKDEVETLTKELEETRNRLWQQLNRLWEISNAMEEGIDEGMDAESCWSRACAIGNGEDTYTTMHPFDDEKSVDEF